MTELADVNVLVALLFERHVHHPEALEWFRTRDRPFATTGVTQSGFVRVSSNPRLPGALTVLDAVATMSALCDHAEHRFLPDRHGIVGNTAVPFERLIGHRQITDAHLVAIARDHGARLVTFDRGCADLGGDDVRLLGES